MSDIKLTFLNKNSIEDNVEYLSHYLEDVTNMVYISHPYGGNIDNVNSLSEKLKILIKKYPYGNFISPIHNFSYLEYSNESYDEDLNRCIRILGMCDYMFLMGDWKSSTGCTAEYNYCIENDIPIVFIEF